MNSEIKSENKNQQNEDILTFGQKKIPHFWREKIRGAIFGLCTADALGVPVEFISRDELRQDPVDDMRGFGTYDLPPGFWSDDSSMTFCLMDSLSKELNYQDILQKFSQWALAGAYTPAGLMFDIGNTTRAAINRFNQGVPPLECGGKLGRDNGNGSLMRILPALFHLILKVQNGFEIQNEHCFQIIHNLSQLTHANPRSMMACGIYLSIAAEILQFSPKPLPDLIQTGAKKALSWYQIQPNFIAEIPHYSWLADIKALAEKPETEIVSSGYVVTTLEAALWCLSKSDSYRDCALKAVNLGEDSDTIAAVAGGLAGLRYGFAAIPADWIAVLARRDWIEELCDRFCVAQLNI